MGKKYVYVWNKNRVEGNSKMKDILGGKGANLAEMASLGLPVPPGFTISAEVCKYYWDNNRKFPEDLAPTVEESMRELENVTGKKFGDNNDPLLVSVRSGAAISMPGMMDTILNLGLNDESVEGLAKLTNNERFAWDSYRRFIQMFGDVALGIPHEKFEEALNEVKNKKGVKQDLELDANDLKNVVELYKKLYKEEGKEFPQDPMKQLWIAIEAVFGSWNNPRAIKYRQINEMDKQGLLGTAVNEKKYYGEFLPNAQGEDVVAGIRTPKSLDELKNINPKTYNQLLEVMDKLESHFRDMQDIEFTVERGQLYMLQTRNGKRTAAAAVKIAVDMVKEGLINKQEAVMRVKPADIEKLLHPLFDPEELKNAQYIGKGLPASPGAATGKIVFSADDAENMAKDGEKVILARPETSPEDVGGMNVAEGILTSRGGMTSHAAVVARGMGKTAVVGAEDVVIDLKNKVIKSNGVELKEGDWISIDGNEGKVYAGKVKTVRPEGLAGDISVLLEYADEVSVLGVRANADIPRDAKVAREFGAQGIGLCRTEHMFFGPERINKMRTMIVSKTEEQRRAALEQLLPYQRSDFKGLFEEMEGFSVTIRLLDPPLHEFVPESDEQIKEVAKMIGISEDELRSTVKDLEEFNPMMGHRGVRLAITYPEIAEMQTKAIILAAIDMIKEGKKVQPEIMIPLVGNVKELTILKESIKKIADELIKENNVDLEYKIGTMIEVPRACVVADQIGAEADFFSFGTNDLTQLGLGFSRDDYGKFIGDYIEKGIYEKDPFQQIDREGVGRLIKLALDGGRSTNPKLKVGICGEHGGDPDSIEFAHLVGLDYVSCSPYRVPVARLAAAQAAVNYKRGKTVNY